MGTCALSVCGRVCLQCVHSREWIFLGVSRILNVNEHLYARVCYLLYVNMDPGVSLGYIWCGCVLLSTHFCWGG
jgi:hypothetical protein